MRRVNTIATRRLGGKGKHSGEPFAKRPQGHCRIAQKPVLSATSDMAVVDALMPSVTAKFRKTLFNPLRCADFFETSAALGSGRFRSAIKWSSN